MQKYSGGISTNNIINMMCLTFILIFVIYGFIFMNTNVEKFTSITNSNGA